MDLAEKEEGTVLYDKNKDELTHTEIWDDTLLIAKYDESMTKARRMLASKLSSASELTDSDCSNSHRTEPVNGSGAFCKASYIHDSCGAKKKRKKGRKKNEWHTGDPCRARYSEDGQLYEATIMAMDKAACQCSVRFVGYNNCDEVAQSALLKSSGDGARRKQMQLSIDALAQSEDVTEDDSCAGDSEPRSETRRRRHHHKATTAQHHHKPSNNNPPASYSATGGMPMGPPKTPDQHFSRFPLLPDLPPPPALGIRAREGDAASSEALHTMLMSWYMTGYHTGYYHALTKDRSEDHRDDEGRKA